MSDLLPPIVAELVSRTAPWSQGLRDAKAELAGFAGEVDRQTGKVGDAEEAMASRGTTATRNLDKAHQDLEGKTSGFASRMSSTFGSLGGVMGSWGIPFGQSVSKMGDKITEAEGKGHGFSAALAQVGKAASVVTVAGLIAAGGASIHMAADFQQSMTELVTGAGESEANLKTVSSGILSVAGQVGESTQQLSSGMYMIESAGYHGSAGLAVLKASAEGAKVGAADLGSVANAVTTALHDYHLPASQAADVTSALVQTVASGKTHMQDLASTLGKVMPQASALGVSFQQVTGAMATMTNAGMSARLASMRLSNTILALSAPSGAAQKAMNSVGLSAQQLKTALSTQGLTGAIKLVEDHVGAKFPAGSVASVEAFKAIMGGATGYSTALMLGGKNMAGFEANVAGIGKALDRGSGQVQGFSKTQKDLAFQADQAKATIEALGIRLGGDLIPIVQTGAKDLGDLVSWFEQNRWAAYSLAAMIGGPLAIAMGAFAVNKVAGMVKGAQDAVKNLQKLEQTTVKTATTLLEKFGVITKGSQQMEQTVSQSAETQARNVEQAANQQATGAESAATREATGVEASTTGMAGTVGGEVSGMEATVGGEFATGAGAVEATVATEAATVDSEFGAMAATAATEAATVEADAAAAEAAVGAGGVAAVALPLAGAVAYNWSQILANDKNFNWQQQAGGAPTGLGMTGPAGGLNLGQLSGINTGGLQNLGGLAALTPRKHKALGTDRFEGGLTWLAEDGPELVNLPAGSSVTPTGETQRTLEAGGGGSKQTVIVNAQTNADPNQIAIEVGWALRSFAGV